ncbi:MAG TPA: glycosyltransferase family 4 protein [Syntrophorhabdaceae bacterium]|nr:glycosyltransferase family 4 protein [Syntrophorhabdaceae bacterium]
MKIGLSIYHFNPKKGGAERYAYDLSLMLSRKGHQVFVFCTEGITVPEVSLIRVGATPIPRWLRSLSFALNQKKLVRRRGLDVVLGFGNTLDLDVYQSHGGIQHIWMEREIASYDHAGERRLKAFLLQTSLNQRVQQWVSEYPIRQNGYRRIVAISEMIKRQMTDYYGLSEKDIDVVYNGVDINRFRPSRREPSGPLTILFSAGNFRLKGLSPLISALGQLSRKTRSFQLLVMGRGRREPFEAMAEKLSIRDRVRFVGEMANPESIYQQAHILVHPTFYDACSLTTMEAMASGLPTITTKWNGASALISEDEGYVIDDPRNAVALSQAIRELFDSEKRKSMGQMARLKMENYTMEKNANELERILAEVTKEGARTP